MSFILRISENKGDLGLPMAICALAKAEESNVSIIVAKSEDAVVPCIQVLDEEITEPLAMCQAVSKKLSLAENNIDAFNFATTKLYPHSKAVFEIVSKGVKDENDKSPDDIKQAFKAFKDDLTELNEIIAKSANPFLGGTQLCLADFLIGGLLFIGVCPKSFTLMPPSISKQFGQVMKYVKAVTSSATLEGKSDKKNAYFILANNMIKDCYNSMKTKVDFSTVAQKGGKKEVTKENEVKEVPRRSRPPLAKVGIPEKGKRNILITSALPYVNNIPHLGNIIGSVLSADVYARYCRQRGYNTLFICGTDEYGTATETKAKEEGLTPRQICNKYHDIHDAVYKWFDISFDQFGRTSCDDPKTNKEWPQTVIAQDIFTNLHKNDFLVEDQIDQVYCLDCNTFLADRFIEGTCPKCGYTDARGDQCDKCTTLLNATEIIDPKCKTNKEHKVEVRKSEHVFLNLPKLSNELVEWFNKSSEDGKWTSNAKSITKGWIESGLQKRCITRDLKWGTPVPLDKYKDKVFYVWFDAPIGYLSITANYTKDWEKWWKNPEDVKLTQFMGKDNCPFHSVIFPSTLLGTRENWTLVNKISCTEYLNYEGDKFSKSRGKGVFGNNAKDTNIPSEIWRYYLLSIRPETSDSMFYWDDFADRNNNELLKNIGNFINRTLAFAYNKMDKKVPKCSVCEEREDELMKNVNEQLSLYISNMEDCQLKNGLKIVMDISRLGNQYLQDREPWSIIKTNKPLSESVVHISIELVRLLAAIIEPFMPGFSDKIFYQLNMDHIDIPTEFTINNVEENHPLPYEPIPIFRNMTVEEIEGYKKKFSGDQV